MLYNMGKVSVTTHYKFYKLMKLSKTIHMGEQKEKRPTSFVGNIPDYPAEM